MWRDWFPIPLPAWVIHLLPTWWQRRRVSRFIDRLWSASAKAMEDHTRHAAHITRRYQLDGRGGLPVWRVECDCGYVGPQRLNKKDAEGDLDSHLKAKP